MIGDHAVLEVKNLAVRYGLVPVVAGASFAVQRGRIATIIGSNGAGKSTILRAVARLIPASQGEITFAGQSLAYLEPETVVNCGLSFVPEGRRLFYAMTVRENLELGAWRRRDGQAIKRDLEIVLNYFPALRNRLTSRAVALSGGQQQMVAIGRALMSAPRLLMLDEPSIGLAPSVVQTMGEIIQTIRDNGVDILLVEQNAKMALEISDHAYVLEGGRITRSGNTRSIAADDFVRTTYLGL